MKVMDLQGRFSLRWDFDTQSLMLKIQVINDNKIFEASIPFLEKEMPPIKFTAVSE